VKRRGFLIGAIAAPTIIGIDGRMRFFMPPPRCIIDTSPVQIVTHPFLDDNPFTTDDLHFKVRKHLAVGYMDRRLLFGTQGQ